MEFGAAAAAVLLLLPLRPQVRSCHDDADYAYHPDHDHDQSPTRTSTNWVRLGLHLRVRDIIMPSRTRLMTTGDTTGDYHYRYGYGGWHATAPSATTLGTATTTMLPGLLQLQVPLH
jgi:hypothetical protein